MNGRMIGRSVKSAAAVSLAVALYLVALPAAMRVPWVKERLRQVASAPRTRELEKLVMGRRFSPFGLLTHTGRRTGTEHVAGLGVFPLGDGFAFALEYGRNVDWCRNVVATGTCRLKWKGQEYTLGNPEIIPMSRVLEVLPPWALLSSAAGGIEEALWVHRLSGPTPRKSWPPHDSSRTTRGGSRDTGSMRVVGTQRPVLAPPGR